MAPNPYNHADGSKWGWISGHDFLQGIVGLRALFPVRLGIAALVALTIVLCLQGTASAGSILTWDHKAAVKLDAVAVKLDAEPQIGQLSDARGEQESESQSSSLPELAALAKELLEGLNSTSSSGTGVPGTAGASGTGGLFVSTSDGHLPTGFQNGTYRQRFDVVVQLPAPRCEEMMDPPRARA